MSNSPKYVLQTKNLSKFYGKFKGIEDLNLKVEPGTVFGFLGPNGAGKTTAIRTIMNFLKPTHGSAIILGMDSEKNSTELKKHVGYLAGDFELYGNLTGKQYLEFVASMQGCKQIDKTIDNLAEFLQADLSRKLGTLSRGNMQKIALIAALVHDPKLLILDEPTTGLDPLIQNQFYSLVRDLKKRGRTIFMSSHILSEVQIICDKVAFMKEGKVVEIVDVNEVKRSRKKIVTIHKSKSSKKIMPPNFEHIEVLEQSPTMLKFITKEESKSLLRWLSIQAIDDVIIENVSLEDMFLKLYGTAEVHHA